MKGFLVLLVAFAPATLALAELIPQRLGTLTPPLVYVATMWAMPIARPLRRPLVSPHNTILAGFAIQLVVAPLLLVLDGAVQWVFPVDQTWGALQRAALLIAASFPCWALGAMVFDRFSKGVGVLPDWGRISRRTTMIFAGIGFVGLALVVARVGVSATNVDGSASGPVQVLRLELRPFLAAAGIGVLSNAMLAGHSRWRELRWPVLICLALVVMAYASVDWRRAPLLATFIGVLAGISLLRDWPGLPTLIGLGVAATGAFFAIRLLRGHNVYFNTTGDPIGPVHVFSTEVQSYAGGVQMVAFLLDHIQATGHQLYGLGQFYGAASPLPIVGAPFRDTTPLAIYNGLFLNRTDQVLPLAGQFYLDFGTASVLVGFVGFGVLTRWLHLAFANAKTLIEAVVWATPAAWLTFALGSGPVGFYQSVIYFSAPSFVLVAMMWWRRRHLGAQK